MQVSVICPWILSALLGRLDGQAVGRLDTGDQQHFEQASEGPGRVGQVGRATLRPMSQIYATATHIPSGEVTRTLGPFETRHAARVAVGETVAQLLTWERLNTGAYIAEKYPTLWVVEVRGSDSLL